MEEVKKGSKYSPFNGAQKMKIPKMDIPGLLKRLVDPSEPWVITPNGSMFGYFDFVPEHLRVGPWTFLMPFYLIGLVGMTYYFKPELISEKLERVYPEPYTSWWYYNVVVGMWMFAFTADIFIVRAWTTITYTVQMWIYGTLRHVLTALAPFLSETNPLLSLNEFLRFPSLVTATVAFTMWNFFIAPGIYLTLDTPEKREGFRTFNFSFRLIQLHFFNMIFAVLNTISVSPRRMFTMEDLWCSLSLAAAYNIFYFLVLDRLGIHLYPIFSPRWNYMFIFVILSWLMYYGAFIFWNKTIENGTFVIDE